MNNREMIWGILGGIVSVGLGLSSAILMMFPTLILSALGFVLSLALIPFRSLGIRNLLMGIYTLTCFGILFIELFMKVEGGM